MGVVKSEIPSLCSNMNLMAAEFSDRSLSITNNYSIPNAINISLSVSLMSSDDLDFRTFTCTYFDNLPKPFKTLLFFVM